VVEGLIEGQDASAHIVDAVVMRTNAVTPQACERVTLDTTVQTKAIAHPTDSHLETSKNRANLA